MHDIGNASCGYVISSVSFAKPFGGNSREGGGEREDRGKIYRIYYSGKTQGRKELLYGAATISREWIFPIRLLLCPSLLLSLPLPAFSVAGKWHYRYSICFFAHTHTHILITPRTGNAARYFVARKLWIQTRIDRNASLESADVSFIIPSPLKLRRRHRRDSHCSFIASIVL